MTNPNEQLSLSRLQNLQTAFSEIQIDAKLIEKNEQFEMHSLLLAAEDDYQGRTTFVNLAYVNDLSDEESNLALLQYFTELPVVLEEDQLQRMEALLNFVNIRMPLGHFCTQNNKVYLRYVLAESKRDEEYAMKTIETFFMFVDVMDIFQESIEQIISGNLTYEAFKSKF